MAFTQSRMQLTEAAKGATFNNHARCTAWMQTRVISETTIMSLNS